MDDVILLSRLQFAVAVFFHFIFVPLTLGLSLLIALMETRCAPGMRSGASMPSSGANFSSSTSPWAW